MFGFGDDNRNDGRVIQANAFLQYDYLARGQISDINNDPNIDPISKQELIDQVNQGKSNLNTNTSNADTYNNIINNVFASVNAYKSQAQAATEPKFAERRFLQHMTEIQKDNPGRSQTVLTQREYTPGGAPTLLTGKK